MPSRNGRPRRGRGRGVPNGGASPTPPPPTPPTPEQLPELPAESVAAVPPPVSTWGSLTSDWVQGNVQFVRSTTAYSDIARFIEAEEASTVQPPPTVELAYEPEPEPEPDPDRYRCGECAGCGQMLWSDASDLRYEAGSAWHEDCWYDHTFECDDCGGRVRHGYSCLCTPRPEIYVNRHDYNPSQLAFHQIVGESSEVAQNEYVGLELEVAFGRNRNRTRGWQDLARLLPDPEDFFYKHDGSIAQGTEGEGVELVSHPATWAYWALPEVRERWNERLALLRANGFRSYDAGSCGLHLHVSRAPYTATSIVRLQTLVYQNPTLFTRLSQRTNFEYCTFDGPDATDFQFRVRKAGVARYRQSYRHFDYNPSANHHRRVAVNLPADTPTIEFRFFRGTLHQPSFWKAFECVRACTQYVRESTLEEQTDVAFLRWVYQRERQFPHLTQFLDRWYRELRSGQPRGKQTPQYEFPDVPERSSTGRRQQPLGV